MDAFEFPSFHVAHCCTSPAKLLHCVLSLGRLRKLCFFILTGPGISSFVCCSYLSFNFNVLYTDGSIRTFNVQNLHHSVDEPSGRCFLLSKLNIFQQVLGRRPESKPKFKPPWDARVQAWGRNRARTSMKMLRIVAYGFVSLFFTTFSLFFATFSLSYGGVRCRFLLACSFFDLFGSGQASVTRKMRAIPFYPSLVRTKDASKYPP